MMKLQNNSVAVTINPQTVATNGTATGLAVDTLGADELDIIVSAISATTSAIPDTVVIQHADVTNTSSFAAITGGTFQLGVSTGYPTQVTNATASTTPFAKINVNWLGKKRYVRVLTTASTNGAYYVSADVRLARQEVSKSGTSLGAAFVTNVA